MSQAQRIKEYIEEYGSITPVDAMKEFGCMRLAARINDLERQGVAIIHDTECSTNRYGQKVRYARYRIGTING